VILTCSKKGVLAQKDGLTVKSPRAGSIEDWTKSATGEGISREISLLGDIDTFFRLIPKRITPNCLASAGLRFTMPARGGAPTTENGRTLGL
jgi:hypothetical protein